MSNPSNETGENGKDKVLLIPGLETMIQVMLYV